MKKIKQPLCTFVGILLTQFLKSVISSSHITELSALVRRYQCVMSLVLGENDVVFSETYDVLINTYPQGQITILNMQIHNKKCFNRPLLHLTWTRRITFFKKMFGDYTTIYSVMDTLCSQCNYLG